MEEKVGRKGLCRRKRDQGLVHGKRVSRQDGGKQS